MKKLLLLSLVALAALSLTTATISAKTYADSEKKVQGSTTCKTCHREMGNEKHHCQCAHKVCVKPVQALEHAPMTKVCENKDRCPEGTTVEKDKHGHDVCVEYRAERVVHPKICDTTCTWACPTNYDVEEITPGKVEGKVHDNNHVAKRSRKMRNDDMNMNDDMTETVEKTTKRVRRAAPAA